MGNGKLCPWYSMSPMYSKDGIVWGAVDKLLSNVQGLILWMETNVSPSRLSQRETSVPRRCHTDTPRTRTSQTLLTCPASLCHPPPLLLGTVDSFIPPPPPLCVLHPWKSCQRDTLCLSLSSCFPQSPEASVISLHLHPKTVWLRSSFF